jgi:hypothetical protein
MWRLRPLFYGVNQMGKILETTFNADVRNRRYWGKWANQIARDMGLHSLGEIDSFRHAYTAAKVSEKYSIPYIQNGDSLARLGGFLNELGGIFSNTMTDHLADLRNNEIGMQIRTEVDQNLKLLQKEFGWSDDLVNQVRARHLRLRILDAVKSGRLNQDPLHSTIKANGEVFVHEYDRKSGHVQAYTRGWPHSD